MKLKNYFIIFCLLMVLVGCAGAASAVSDDSINNGQSGVGTTDNPIPVTNNNQALGVGAGPASSAQGENNGGNSIQSSLADDNSSKLSGTGDVEYYVNVTGSDDNPGTQSSPFATIAKAISSADESKNVIIYLGEGTFTGEGNTDLEISLANLASGGSITFIGADGKTIIDGENLKAIIKSISANSIVTFRNIKFINGKSTGNGGIINSQGYLTIDNCVFTDSTASSYGGAIYHNGKDFTLTNSVFEKDVSNSNGGAIYVQTGSSVNILNNTFINCSCGDYSYGTAAYIYASGNCYPIIHENKFINLTASGNKYDAGLYGYGEIINNTFENCTFTGNTGGIMYVSGYLSGNKFINSTALNGPIFVGNRMNFLVKINDVTTTSPSFTLTANVTDIDGNKVSFNSKNFRFYIDGTYVARIRNAVNGVISYDVTKLLDNGEHVVTATLATATEEAIFVNGTLTVNIDRTPIELWVDSATGEDVDTAGSKTTPYKTIQYAINQGLAKSLFIAIHINDGVYSGAGNTGLSIGSLCEISFMGESKEGTIIDGEFNKQIFSSINANAVTTIENLSLINGKTTSSGGAIYTDGPLTVDNCIFINDTANYGGAIYVGGYGKSYNIVVNNSEFINCSSAAHIMCEGGQSSITFENNIITNLTDTTGSSAYSICDLNAQNIIFSNNIFKDINYFKYRDGLFARLISATDGDMVVDSNKFINSNITNSYYLLYIYRGRYINITNNEFINVSSTAGAIYNSNSEITYLKNNTFTDSSLASYVIIQAGTFSEVKLVFLDNQTTSHLFNLTALITDVDGNPISTTRSVDFNVDGENIGRAKIIKGVATLECNKFLENGEYVINGTIDIAQNTILTTGTLTVNITVNPKEYYISETGDDENGDGTKSKPFKTLKKALDQAYGVDKSYDVTIHVLDGTYSGVGNVNLSLNDSCAGVLRIAGEAYGKAIFDGNGDGTWFWKMPKSTTSGFAIPASVAVSIENITLNNFATSNNYGSIILSAASEFNITNCIFDSIYSGSSYFGIIHNPNGLITIKNSTFYNLTVKSSSVIGGVMVVDNSSFINCTGYRRDFSIYRMYNSEVINCSSTGGWSNVNNDILETTTNAILENNTFINNTAKEGIILVSSGANIINNTFIDNKISSGSTINANSNTNITNSKFINNTGSYGGAIYAKANVNLTNVTFENNLQSGVLNDIYMGYNGKVSGLTLVFNNIVSTMTLNEIVAELISDEGAIVSGGNVAFYVNGTNVGSKAIASNIASINYDFGKTGEFILNGTYNNGDASLIIAPGVALILEIVPSNFTDLYVSDSMGSDDNNGSINSPFKTIKKAVFYAYGHDDVTIHVLEGTYAGLQNTNILVDTTKLTIEGAGISETVIDAGDANYFFNIQKGSVVIKNLTMANGYATESQPQISISNTAALVLENIKYENNTKHAIVERIDQLRCGIVNNGALTVINSTFSDNYQVVNSNEGSVLRIYNSTFTKNSGLYGYLRILATTSVIDNCTFSENSAVINGKNIKISNSRFIRNKATGINGEDLNVVGCNFTDNYAYEGAGIKGTGYVSDCIFTNNSASSSGGAMSFTGEIYNCEFYNNTAATIGEGAGGAILANGGGGDFHDSQMATTLVIIGNCYFEGNKALTSGGGAMLTGGGAIMNYANLIIIDCTFVDNYAVQRGGAIRNGLGYDNAVLTVYSSKFINNYAGNNGGAITSYMDPSQYSVIGTIHIHSSEFINNTAGATGGAIEIFRTNADIDDCLFDGNYALNGGAISALSKTTITTSNFTNNNGFSGGAIRVQGNVEISKSVFENNTASTGGAIDSVGGTLSAVYSVFVDNTADALGDAIFEGSANTYITDLSNNWWGVNDNPNQFIYSNYTIDSWVVANLSPNLTEISVGEAVDFTVNFTDNSNNQLADSIPARVLCVGDAEYPLADNTAGFTVCADDAGFIVISVDNQVFDLEVVYPSVTNSTFFNFFDKDGYLRDNITADTLIFVGEFSNLGVDAIRINKAVDLIGDGAVLNDIGLVIIADDVTVDDFEINLSNESSAGAAIVVYGDDVCVENSLITVNSSEDDESFAILVEDAEDFILINNVINYTGNSDGSAVNNAIRLEDADGAVIEDNIINITIPSVPVTYTPPTWEATVLSEGIVVDSSDDVVLSNNTINVDYNKVTGAYDSVYAVEFVDSDNAVITDNEITTNGNSYAYGLTINGENFTVEGNNISTTGNNYANGIQINGPASGNVSDNNIDAEAPSVVYPVYSYGKNVVSYTDNNISGTSNSVYAMELFGTNETVKDNNIVANGNFTIGVASKSKNLVLENNTIIANGTNKGTPTSGDSIKSETTGVKAVGGSTAITNNTIISTGDSAVKTEASGYIANNTLVANDTTGDAAVDYAPNQGLIVDDNVPKMEKVFITADDIVMYYKNGTRYVITLSDGSGNLLANKPVTITINGVSYSRATNAQGTASVALNLVAGNYTASASFAGDENYGKASIENTVTILSTISADNLVKVHKNASQYYATFTDGQGNPLAKTDVTFNINGVMYTRKTNENGTAKLNINLDQGTFVITATNPINGETHSNNITVLSRIVDNKDLVKYYKNASQYVVTLIGDDGNPVGAGETVTFNINGVFYTRTTNATGQAKLNINLDPGVFVITAEYKGCKVSNTVTVKPVLSASDLTKKYGTPDQFIATLLDGQGNPVDGEIVTFNINGVFYNRITRDGGKAPLNINLQPGEFIITSSYNGTSISNTVKVEA